MKKFAPFLVMFAALLWSADALLRVPLTERLSAPAIVFYEHVFGFVLVLPFLVRGLRQLRQLNTKDWSAVLFIALGGSLLATVFFTAAFSYVSPSVAILLQKVQPLIAILLAATLLKEAISRHFWIWAVIAIGGAYLVSFPEIAPGALSSYDGSARGIIFALAAAFFWGASTVFGRFVLRKVQFQVMTSIRITLAMIMLGAYFLVSGRGSEIAGIAGVDTLRLIAIALFTGTGALFIYYRGLADTKASVATIAELMFPFSAVVLNWVFLGDSLTAMQLFGGVVLVYAIYRVSLLNRRMEGPAVGAEQQKDAKQYAA